MKNRVKTCKKCGLEYCGEHNSVDSIILFKECCTCFRGRDVEGYSQILAIHNFNRVDRKRTDEECKQIVEDYINDPDKDIRKEWELLGFGCGSDCGSCTSCGS